MTSNYSRNYCQILQKEYIKDDSAQIMWRLLSSKLTNFKEIVDYKESILFSKVSHMSKKIMKKNLKDECISLPELPVKLILCFFSPDVFYYLYNGLCWKKGTVYSLTTWSMKAN